MNIHNINMESVIDFVTNGDVSDLSKLSSDDKLEDEIQMVANTKVNLLTMKSTFVYPKLLLYHHFLPLKLSNRNRELTSH